MLPVSFPGKRGVASHTVEETGRRLSSSSFPLIKRKPCKICKSSPGDGERRPEAMCKLKLTKERVGCYLLVILLVVLLIGVLFGLGVFRHGYERFRDLGRNHTCYDCNRV